MLQIATTNTYPINDGRKWKIYERAFIRGNKIGSACNMFSSAACRFCDSNSDWQYVYSSEHSTMRFCEDCDRAILRYIDWFNASAAFTSKLDYTIALDEITINTTITIDAAKIHYFSASHYYALGGSEDLSEGSNRGDLSHRVRLPRELISIVANIQHNILKRELNR